MSNLSETPSSSVNPELLAVKRDLFLRQQAVLRDLRNIPAVKSNPKIIEAITDLQDTDRPSVIDVDVVQIGEDGRPVLNSDPRTSLLKALYTADVINNSGSLLVTAQLSYGNSENQSPYRLFLSTLFPSNAENIPAFYNGMPNPGIAYEVPKQASVICIPLFPKDGEQIVLGRPESVSVQQNPTNEPGKDTLIREGFSTSIRLEASRNSGISRKHAILQYKNKTWQISNTASFEYMLRVSNRFTKQEGFLPIGASTNLVHGSILDIPGFRFRFVETVWKYKELSVPLFGLVRESQPNGILDKPV